MFFFVLFLFNGNWWDSYNNEVSGKYFSLRLCIFYEIIFNFIYRLIYAFIMLLILIFVYFGWDDLVLGCLM